MMHAMRTELHVSTDRPQIRSRPLVLDTPLPAVHEPGAGRKGGRALGDP